MCLIGKTELLLLDYVVNVLILAHSILRPSIFARLRCLRVNLLSEARVISEKFSGINERNRINRDVRCLMFKAAMYIYTSIYTPDGRTEALNSSEFVPFRRLCVINFESDIFTNLICAATNYHHDWAKENC